MRTLKLSSWITPVAIGAVVGITTSSLRAGGGEVFCNPVDGSEIQERWLNIPPSGIEWEVNLALVVNHPCPGYPQISCLSPSTSLQELPAIQSLYRASQAWTTAEAPGVPGSSISTFAYEDPPSAFGYTCCTPPAYLNTVTGVLDGRNIVNLWEPESSFTLWGGGATVAVADVAVNLSTGQILEADIAFNTLSEATPDVPCWSFVEANQFDGRTYASTSHDVTAFPFFAPTMGYADLEGIAVHEFGHALGLGHSLVDGRQVPTESTTPTMFETSHTEALPDTVVSYHDPFTCTYSSVTINGNQTPLGGLLGAGLKSLEPDDLAALGALYPSNDFANLTGSISGAISDAFGNEVLGAHVVAIAKTRPTDNRVGGLSMQGGNYSLQGLEPGDYYVCVEPVDQAPGGFFSRETVPSYVDLLGATGCISAVIQHQTEFWDVNEGTGEVSPMAASLITVSAGAATVGIDIVVESLPDVLTVSSGASSSTRGIVLVPQAGLDPVVTFQASFGIAQANRLARLILGPDHAKRVLGGILLQASQSGPPGWPIQHVAQTDALGDVSFNVTITDGMAHHELISQVAIRAHSGLPPAISNAVSVAIERP